MRDLTTQPYPVNVWAVCTCVSLPDKITEKRAKVVQPTTAAKDQKQDREFLGMGGNSIQHSTSASGHQNRPRAAVPKSGWHIHSGYL